MTEAPAVLLEVRDHVLLMGLNRAHKKNAFNLRMLCELSEAYTRLEAEPDLRCGLLYGVGGDFTTGLDLAEVGPAVASGNPLFPDGGIDLFDLALPRRTKPVVCVAQGWCLTIGIELLLASDIRFCAGDTRFRQMEVNRGIMPFGGATLRFPQVAGWGNAMRWLLSGAEFDAAEALRIGVAQEVVAAEQSLDHALQVALDVAKCAPLAVQATRMASRVAVEEGADAARKQLMTEARRLMTTADAAEGVRSFVERREAVFRGK